MELVVCDVIVVCLSDVGLFTKAIWLEDLARQIFRQKFTFVNDSQSTAFDCRMESCSRCLILGERMLGVKSSEGLMLSRSL